MWWTLGSVHISKQSLYSFKKLHFWELEMNSIILIRFNCLLGFISMMGGEFACAAINNKGTFLYHHVGYLKYFFLLLVYCFCCMHLRWSLILLFLVLFAEFQSGFLELRWLEQQSRFCYRCWSCWYWVLVLSWYWVLVLSWYWALVLTDHSAFVSSAIVLICWLLFLTSFEISKKAPMKKLPLSKASSAIVGGVFWLSR